MSTTSRTEGDPTCPLCDDYRGDPSSVEAHISRKTDPIHQGEVGRAYRDHLHDRVVTTEDVESSDDRGPESTDEGFPEGGGPRSEDDGTEVEDDQDELLDDQRDDDDDDDPSASPPVAAGAAETEDVEVVEESGATIPIPVSTTVLFAGVGALLVAVVLWRVRMTDTSTSDQGEPERQEETEPDVSGDTAGLIGSE